MRIHKPRLTNGARSFTTRDRPSPIRRLAHPVTSTCTASAVAVTLIATGCQSQQSFDFDALGLVPAQERLAEVPLGRYVVPIPVVVNDSGEQLQWRNRFEFDFELYALVPPGQEARVADAWKRHEGALRDRVIRVCRTVAPGELQEPELGVLKALLTDAVQQQLGGKDIRQLMITDVISEEI